MGKKVHTQGSPNVNMDTAEKDKLIWWMLVVSMLAWPVLKEGKLENMI